MLETAPSSGQRRERQAETKGCCLAVEMPYSKDGSGSYRVRRKTGVGQRKCRGGERVGKMGNPVVDQGGQESKEGLDRGMPGIRRGG